MTRYESKNRLYNFGKHFISRIIFRILVSWDKSSFKWNAALNYLSEEYLIKQIARNTVRYAKSVQKIKWWKTAKSISFLLLFFFFWLFQLFSRSIEYKTFTNNYIQLYIRCDVKQHFYFIFFFLFFCVSQSELVNIIWNFDSFSFYLMFILLNCSSAFHKTKFFLFLWLSSSTVTIVWMFFRWLLFSVDGKYLTKMFGCEQSTGLSIGYVCHRILCIAYLPIMLSISQKTKLNDRTFRFLPYVFNICTFDLSFQIFCRYEIEKLIWNTLFEKWNGKAKTKQIFGTNIVMHLRCRKIVNLLLHSTQISW